MPRRLLAALSAAAAVSLSLVPLATSADASPSAQGLSQRNDRVCASPQPGFASCSALRHDTVDAAGHPVNRNPGSPTDTAGHAGYGPQDIQSAYKLAGLQSGGATVAIVDAYDDPNAQSDLDVYRTAENLPPCDAGCFTKVSQTGSTTALPAVDGGWAQEISLDLDMVSSTCPDCHILLVEATSSSFADLSTAVDYAAAQHPVAISNSYGGNDTSAYASHYDHPGIAVTASTGDNGYGAQSPATFPGVVAVGGTSLTTANNTRGWTETAWSGAGSGCSRYNAKPSYQTSVTKCTRKADADVSAVADPNTGVAVYDSLAYQGYVGWMVFGGTSASSPIIASVYALAHDVAPTAQAGALPWGNAGSLFDVTSGSNGGCGTKIWCHAGAGWDGPTGLGTPNGIAAF